MPPRPTLRIAEIFGSVQGEGLRQGQPTVFIRLAGCNLRCPFCDTKTARRGGRRMTPAGVVAAVVRLRRRWPADWADITGGEPMLQDLEPLVRGLRAEGLSVQVETNGTVFRPAPYDWITVSPKPPDYAVAPDFRSRAREVKLVVTPDLAYAVLKSLRRRFPENVPLILQPRSNSRTCGARAVRLLGRAMEEGKANIRLGVQLHRVLGAR